MKILDLNTLQLEPVDSAIVTTHLQKLRGELAIVLSAGYWRLVTMHA